MKFHNLAGKEMKFNECSNVFFLYFEGGWGYRIYMRNKGNVLAIVLS